MLLFCLECLSSGIWSDSHALREAARGKGNMREAELFWEMMCLAAPAPRRAQAAGGTAGGGYSGIQRLTPAACHPTPSTRAPRSLGRDPRERHHRLGGCSRAHAGLVRRPFCSTSRPGCRGQRSRVHREQARAPHHSPLTPSPTLPRGLWHRGDKHPQDLVPGNYQANSRRLPLPTPGSARCVFPDSGPDGTVSARGICGDP